MRHLVGLIGENVRRGLAVGEFASVDHGEVVMFGRRALVLEGVLPPELTKGYYCRRALVHVDAESGLLMNIRIYDWTDRLVEEYGYEDFKPDLTLTTADFSPENPRYRF